MKILSIILWIPLLGAFVTAVIPNRGATLFRLVALATTGTALLVSCSLPFLFEPLSRDLQLVERTPWNPAMGSEYALGVDGFSLPMVMLSCLLSVVAVVASGGVNRRPRGYFVWMLALEFGMVGVFMARDWALFYVFWELTLIPLFFLIDQWGGTHRHRASLNFVLYTMGGSVFMLLALLAVYTASPHHSTAMESMSSVARTLPAGTQTWVLAGLIVGFGVKLPIVPLHGWLPLAHVEAPSPVSILLSGSLLKMGGYGLIRSAEMLPQAVLLLQPLLGTLALLSIIYGGLIAWRQTDLKAMIAYSSISHMGVVLLGIASLNPMGMTGAALQMIAHGLVAGALFLLAGLLYERTHTRTITECGMMIRGMPRFGALISLTLLATVGLPGTMGFVAELHVLIGSLLSFGNWTALLGAGILICAAYAFRTISELLTAPGRPTAAAIPDLKMDETIAAGVLVIAAVAFGLFPAPSLSVLRSSVDRILSVL